MTLTCISSFNIKLDECPPPTDLLPPLTGVFLHSDDELEVCSLKVLQPEGSPSRMLLRLMGERGCTTGHLIDHLQTLGNSEALECLKPSGGKTQVRLTVWLWQRKQSRPTQCSLRCSSPADHRSAPVCGSPVWPQPAPHLLRCGQVTGAVPVVQD